MGAYVPVLTMVAVAAALVGTLYLVQLGTAVAPDTATVSAFRSGLPPREHAVSRFHARWYAISLLFLAFDVEMLFMYPWAVVVARVGTPAVVEMFVFLGLLMAGVLYAWREGALRWA